MGHFFVLLTPISHNYSNIPIITIKQKRLIFNTNVLRVMMQSNNIISLIYIILRGITSK